MNYEITNYGFYEDNLNIKHKKYIEEYKLPGCNSPRYCDFCSRFNACLNRAIESLVYVEDRKV